MNCKVRPLRLGVACRLVDALLDMWCELHLIKATATEAVEWHSLVEMLSHSSVVPSRLLCGGGCNSLKLVHTSLAVAVVVVACGWQGWQR